jgi:hypothetical protein
MTAENLKDYVITADPKIKDAKQAQLDGQSALPGAGQERQLNHDGYYRDSSAASGNIYQSGQQEAPIPA